MSPSGHENDLPDAEAAWEYAYAYYHRRNSTKDASILCICIAALVFAIGTTIYLWDFQGELSTYLTISGLGIVAFLVCFVALIAHHRIDCRARDFACSVSDSNLCDRTDIRNLYREWQP